MAVANQKGGVAKTTTVATLGAALAERGQRVLLVDLDPQACLTFSVGIDPEDLDKSMHHVLLGGVKARDVLVDFEDGPDLLPATIELATAEVQLARESGPEQALRTALRSLRSSYDWIIVDCPPTLGLLTINSLVASNRVIIPVQTQYYAIKGLTALIKVINTIKIKLNHDLEVLGLLPTFFDGRTVLARSSTVRRRPCSLRHRRPSG